MIASVANARGLCNAANPLRPLTTIEVNGRVSEYLKKKTGNPKATLDFSCTRLEEGAFDTLVNSPDRTALVGAHFGGADLRGVLFSETDVSSANFSDADLSGARFSGAKAVHANFNKSILVGAHFEADVDLSEALFNEADLREAVFEPKLLPNLAGLASAQNLQWLKYDTNSRPLAELRDLFKKAGMRHHVRLLTFAFERHETIQALSKCGWPLAEKTDLEECTRGIVRFIGWELPTAYNLAPARALIVLICTILLFTGPYLYALREGAPRQIWLVLPASRKDGGTEKWVAITDRGLTGNLASAVRFSVSSAFQLGWRDLNVGSWIDRLHKEDGTLRGTGWVRSVSGAQSLVCIYLLAMWVITLFGGLFES